MRQNTCQVIRPGIESLDGRMVLSTVLSSGLNQHIAHVVAAATAHAKVVLKGQITEEAPAQFKITPASGGAEFAAPISAQVQGTGDLGLGTPVSINASVTATKPIKNLVLTTSQGNIDIRTNININGFSTQRYTIVGGTGAYAHASGSGTLQEDFFSEVPDLQMDLAFNQRIQYNENP